MTTPYNQGFCDTCWAAVPPTGQRHYCEVQAAEDLPEQWKGQFRQGMANALKLVLRPPTRVEGNWQSYHRRKARPTTPLTLGDLGL